MLGAPKKGVTISRNPLIYGVPKGSRTPVTAVKGRCPRPLDDGDIGGARRDRTADLYTASVALSQLSYGPENEARILGHEPPFVYPRC